MRQNYESKDRRPTHLETWGRPMKAGGKHPGGTVGAAPSCVFENLKHDKACENAAGVLFRFGISRHPSRFRTQYRVRCVHRMGGKHPNNLCKTRSPKEGRGRGARISGNRALAWAKASGPSRTLSGNGELLSWVDGFALHILRASSHQAAHVVHAQPSHPR
ncbi:MAG: hypothetical protein RIQ93_2642 [Verrucomicrobiota bacterium]|jgi:hypothetical protein